MYFSLLARNAGVVDGNVQPAEARHDLRQHGLDLLGLADVELQGHDLDAGPLIADLSSYGFEALDVDVCDG